MELAILHKLDLYAEVRKIRSDTRGLSFTNHWCSLTDIFAARPDLKSNLLQPTQKQRITARMQILQHQVSLHGLENWQSVPRPVLVNRVCRTPQGVPEFFRSVLSWWTAEGCSRCVLFKNNHIVSLTYNVLSSRAVVRNLFCLIYPLT